VASAVRTGIADALRTERKPFAKRIFALTAIHTLTSTGHGLACIPATKAGISMHPIPARSD